MAIKPTLWILLVDDSGDDIDLYSETLHHNGFNVVAAKNGVQAFEKALQWQPSVIVLDMMLPDIDGVEVCRRLKADARTQHIPVVALSALSDRIIQARARDAGCSSYLVKPCLPPMLLNELDGVLARGGATGPRTH